MAVEKTSLFDLLEIMIKYSDEDFPISATEICKRMSKMSKGQKNISRQTVYNNIDMINKLYYSEKISFYIDKSKRGKYCLTERMFEPSEIRFLMDCVYSNTAIPPNHSVALIKKLQKFVSERTCKNYKALNFRRQSMKSTNQELFYNTEIIDKAISKKKMISFTYMEYGVDKKLHIRGEHYKLSAYGMAAYDNSYYFIGKYPDRENLCHFHISRMKNMALTDETAESVPVDFHLDEYMQKAVFMYSDKPMEIKVRCRNYILDALITRFGQDVVITDCTDDFFTARFTASPMGTRMWAMQMLDCVEVLEPEFLRREIISIIKNSPYEK